MKTVIERLEKWLEAHLPEVRRDLAPGCSDAAIEEFESLVGRPFPESLKQLYRLHDGQHGAANSGPFMDLVFCRWQRPRHIGSLGKISSMSGRPKK